MNAGKQEVDSDPRDEEIVSLKVQLRKALARIDDLTSKVDQLVRLLTEGKQIAPVAIAGLKRNSSQRAMSSLNSLPLSAEVPARTKKGNTPMPPSSLFDDEL